jgi:phosphatidate cytidylyltransferase
MKRVLTALWLVPLTVYIVLFAPAPAFLAVVMLVGLLCFKEYASITETFFPLGALAGLALLMGTWPQIGVGLILFSLAAMCVPLGAADPAAASGKPAALVLGVLYIFGAWKTAILVHAINPHWLMFGLVVNWIGDTGAYYVGRRWGRRKLAPAVSPGKTQEGALASIVTAVIFGVVYLPLAMKNVTLIEAAGLSVAANVAGQLGDLAESAIKRGAGVKDSGTLLPGHGGMLDRVDSSLFAIPVLYAIVNAWATR